MSDIQKFSYHTHTNFSDGIGSLEEMVKQAKKIGFEQLGVSDHLIVHKNMKQSPSWNYMEQKRASYIYNTDFKNILDKYKRHCDEIRRISKQENFKLFVGFEVDYFMYDGWEEEFKWFIAQLDIDYLHTGNHFFCSENGEQLINMTYLNDLVLDTKMRQEYILNHFLTLKKAVKSKMFKFLAHIDYLRRFCGESYKINLYKEEINSVLDELQNSCTALEISTKGLRKTGDYYPCAEIMLEASKRNIAFVISDDAHKPEELGADFDKAEKELKKYGICKRLKFLA